MTAKSKTALPVQAGTLGNTVSKPHAYNTPFLLPWQLYRRAVPKGRHQSIHPGDNVVRVLRYFVEGGAMTKQLTPRQNRMYAAFIDFPEGLLSFTLRKICGCQNIADEVMEMRRRGYSITCELEPFVTQDGVKSRIGRYKLVADAGEVCNA